MKNYYQILEVTPASDVAEIREAYRRLSQQNLWDKVSFTELQEAYDVLTSPEKRMAYDQNMFGTPIETPPLANDILDPVDKLASSEFGRRCPMGVGTDCPVARGRVPLGEPSCPECGVDLGTLPEPSDLAEEAPREWVARFDEETGRQHRLGVGRNTVGRESADVLLPDKTVSRTHAYVDITEDRVVTIEDLGSTNGTMINGERLAPNVVRNVQDGDTVRFGSIRLLLRITSANGSFPDAMALPEMPSDFELGQVPSIVPSLALSMPALAQAPAEPEPMNPLERLFRSEPAANMPARARLIATRGDIISEHSLMEGMTTFGRRADCSIVLRNDPYVSSAHAQIEGEGDTFTMTDLGSTNGTLYNGERMIPNDPKVLSTGDEIVIGGTIFRFESLITPPEEAAKEDA